MRKRERFVSLPCLTIAVMLAALIGATGIGSAALAQQAQTASIPSDDLFWPNTVDFKPGPGAVARLTDVVKRAQAPGSQCPTDVDFTVLAGPHPEGPLIRDALATARRDVIEVVLRGFGPSVRVTKNVNSSSLVDMVVISAQSAKDKESPKLDTNSVPRKGSKVKPRDTITVTMVARDHANLWQSGIKTIQLVAESEGGRLIVSENYPPPPPAGCIALAPARRVEATYTVPDNPPPIVRLTAVAEDHVGLMDTDAAEFPTKGDWFGTLKFSSEGVVLGVTTTITDLMDIVLDYDGQGNLTGSLVGNRSFNQQGNPECSWAVTIPNKLRGKLIGSYTPGAEVMSIQLIEPEVAPAPRKDCPRGGYIFSGNSIHEESNFKSALRSPRATGDGRFQFDITWMTGPITSSVSLRLQRAQE
ncbi:MAG: hypothetical protein ACKVP4_04765 [Hyphomicrobium sp.]